MLDLCSSRSASKLEKMTLTRRQEEFELKIFREYVLSVADCDRIINAWRRCLEELSGQKEPVNAEKDILHNKNTVEALLRQSHVCKHEEDVYFQL